jgi:hypothetical protein
VRSFAQFDGDFIRLPNVGERYLRVIVQLSLIQGNAKAASARQVYMSYSEATLKHPERSQPNLDKIKADPVEYVRYKNYVSHMLFAFDEILSNAARAKAIHTNSMVRGMSRKNQRRRDDARGARVRAPDMSRI